jgi:pimeloyl-ACP methyl ester carboxylesterase
MIKLTHVASAQPSAPALLLIPGGPGLSSLTLRSLDLLRRSFELYFVDFPGSNGVPYDRDRSFDELSADLVAEVEKLGKPVNAFGHSFGGFFAAELALRSPRVNGIACVSAPFSLCALKSAKERFEASASPALIEAGDRFYADPTDANLAEWLSLYEGFYFAPATLKAGSELLRRDPVSARFFQNNRKDAIHMEPMLKRLPQWSGKKLFLAGAQDGLISSSIQKEDASVADAQFVEIPEGNHFVTFDQPEAVAQAIETQFVQ